MDIKDPIIIFTREPYLGLNANLRVMGPVRWIWSSFIMSGSRMANNDVDSGIPASKFRSKSSAWLAIYITSLWILVEPLSNNRLISSITHAHGYDGPVLVLSLTSYYLKLLVTCSGSWFITFLLFCHSCASVLPWPLCD
jgi:hypothetical protein